MTQFATTVCCEHQVTTCSHYVSLQVELNIVSCHSFTQTKHEQFNHFLCLRFGKVYIIHHFSPTVTH